MKKRKREALLAIAQRAVDKVPLYTPRSDEFVHEANNVLHRFRIEQWERDRAAYLEARHVQHSGE